MPPPNRADLVEAITLLRVAVERNGERLAENAREGREKRREILDEIRNVLAEVRNVHKGQERLASTHEQVALSVQLRDENDQARDEAIIHSLRQRGDNSGPIALLPPAQVEQPRTRPTGEQLVQAPAAPATPTLGKDVDEFTSSAGRLWGRLPKAAQMVIIAAISAATAGGFVGGSCEAKHRAEEREEQQQRHAAPPDMSASVDFADVRPRVDAGTPPTRPKKRRTHPKPDENHDAMVPRDARAAPFLRSHECTGSPAEPERCTPPSD